MKVKKKLSDIKIKESFAATVPNESKVEACRKYWDEFKKQDRCIVVDHNNVLIDGYIQYLVLKENGIEEVEVEISDKYKKDRLRKHRYNKVSTHYKNEMTTYVYGIHPNSVCNTEFVWRVPKSWIWFAENVEVGDRICCITKFGFSPVLVTKVKILDKCPIDLNVKKVAKKEIIRNGILVDPEKI